MCMMGMMNSSMFDMVVSPLQNCCEMSIFNAPVSFNWADIIASNSFVNPLLDIYVL